MLSHLNKNQFDPSNIAFLFSGVFDASNRVLERNASIRTIGGFPSDLDELINKSE